MKINKKNTTNNNKYLIIGYGKFGRGFAQRLLKEGIKENRIYIVDQDKQKLVDAQNQFSNVLSTSISDFDSLNVFDINEIDIVVIAMSNLEESLMIAANCVRYRDKKYYAKAKNEIHSKLLITLGVDEVVVPEQEVGSRLAYKSLFKSNVEISDINSEFNIINVKLDNINLENKTLIEINLRQMFDCNIFGIKRDGKFFIPSATDILKKNDIVSVVCKKSESSKILDYFGNE